jgi:hypothetical protein
MVWSMLRQGNDHILRSCSFMAFLVTRRIWTSLRQSVAQVGLS